MRVYEVGTNYFFVQTLEFILQDEEITYLYAVKDGAVESSFAHLAAINAGISKDIVQRSNEVRKYQILVY